MPDNLLYKTWKYKRIKTSILSFLFLSSFLFPTDFYVDGDTGDDNNDCSQNSPCATIQHAIDEAVTDNGDVVIVSGLANGNSYSENLLIEKNITLKSADPSEPATIDGSSPDISHWNGSCVVVRTPGGSSSAISPTIQDLIITGGKGTNVTVDGNKDGDFNDPEDFIKKVGGGIIIHKAGLTSKGNTIKNNGDSGTKSGGGVYAGGTGVDVPDPQPNLPPYPDNGERSVIEFENTNFSGNNAQSGHTLMANAWEPDGRSIDFSFPGCNFDVAYDDVASDDQDGVSGYWVKGKDGANFDYSGGITGDLPAITNDVWVDPVDGLDEGNEDGSESNPFKTINYALSIIYPTEDNPITITLLEETYSPLTGDLFPIVLIDNVNIVGQGEETILDANESGRVLTSEDVVGATISKLKIRGGHESPFSGGLFLSGKTIISHVTIEDCKADSGGAGIFFVNDSSILEYVTIVDNEAGPHSDASGGGVYLVNSNPLFSHCSIIGNRAENRGSAIYMRDSDPIFINTTIAGNIDIEPSSNGPPMSGPIVGFGESSMLVVNSIIWGNEPAYNLASYSDFEGEYFTFNSYYSDIELADTDSMSYYFNINSDPLFVNTTNNDFSLQENSVCIDAGTNYFEYGNEIIVNFDESDYNGAAPDMGAYEYEEFCSYYDYCGICEGDNLSAADCSSNSFMHNVYIQLHDICEGECDVGVASYHFVNENNVYIDWQYFVDQGDTLDNGEIVSSTKLFTNTNFNYDTRTFTGDIDFSYPEGTTWNGIALWEVEMIFSEDFSNISGGTSNLFYPDGEISYSNTYGETHFYQRYCNPYYFEGPDVDCAGECGGSLVIDECGDCGGFGTIPDGYCDCEGNVLDCAGICGGLAIDACDVCCANTNSHCDYWAEIGECENNPDYMLYYCAVSCDSCYLINLMDDCGECGGDGSSCSCGSGDFTGDGAVNVLDIVAIAHIIVNGGDPTQNEFCQGDINADGTLNILDIVALANIIISG